MRLNKVFACIAGVMTAGGIHGQALPPAAEEFIPGEVLVQFKPTVTDAEVQGAFRQGGLNLIKHIQTPAMRDHGQMGLTHVSTVLPVPEAVRIIRQLPGVEFAEPNWNYRNQAVSDDPFYTGGLLWGMYGDDLPSALGPSGTTNPFGCQAEKAWAAGLTGSADIFVGVVDTGFQFDHVDLAANVWTNPGEIPGNGIDDDGDGYVDDVHGWNALDDNGTTYDPGYDAHGTHVSGTIGAVGANGEGVAGVNWNVRLISGKFLGPAGSGIISGSGADAVQAIDYMTTLRTRKGLNIVAINCSWGGTGFSQALMDAFTRAAQAGILFTVAAGNSTNNTDLTPYYPGCYDTTASAGYDAVISVGAIDEQGALATFSNFGQNSVDLAAPGVGVYSTVPTNSYSSWNGTSMATPHVTGALALYGSTHPGASPQQAKADLLSVGVSPTESLLGKTVTGGRLDLSTLITSGAAPAPTPAAPANVAATVISGGQVDLSWTDQSDNELGFAIERSTDGQTFTVADTVGANITAYSDHTARPNSVYYYRVRAYNPSGSSDFSFAPSSVTTPVLTPPLAPTALTASALPRGGIGLTWKDNAANESGFQIERRTGTNTLWQQVATVGANIVKYTDTSTTTRTTYTYRTRAVNAAWVSAYSNEVTVKAK